MFRLSNVKLNLTFTILLMYFILIYGYCICYFNTITINILFLNETFKYNNIILTQGDASVFPFFMEIKKEKPILISLKDLYFWNLPFVMEEEPKLIEIEPKLMVMEIKPIKMGFFFIYMRLNAIEMITLDEYFDSLKKEKETPPPTLADLLDSVWWWIIVFYRKQNYAGL